MRLIYEALNQLKTIIDESILNEDIEAMKKYYPNISDQDFMSYIKLDPTYKGGDTAGTYAKWILGLANQGRLDNIGHVRDLLTRFEENKNKLINRDIMRYTSMEDLENALDDEDSYKDETHKQEVRRNKRNGKNADLGKEAELVYENADWEVWVPKTYAASCKLGHGARWCTANPDSAYKYNYYKGTYGGEYYIFLNKNNPDEKYQLHIESYQFADIDNDSVSLQNFIYDNPDLKEFICKLFSDFASKNIQEYYTIDDIAEMVESGQYRGTLWGDAVRKIYGGEIGYDSDYSYLYEYSISELPDLDDSRLKQILQKYADEYDLTEEDFEIYDDDINEFMSMHNDIEDAVRDAYRIGCVEGENLEAYDWLIRELDYEGFKEVGYNKFQCTSYDDSTEGILQSIELWDNQGDTTHSLTLYLPYYGFNGFSQEAFEECLVDNL